MKNFGTVLREEPNLIDVIDELKRNIFLNMNCHSIGVIESFDLSKQVAQVKICYKKSYTEIDGNKQTEVLKDYPTLIDVPIVILSGGLANITMPIKKGDFCLILFNDRDIDTWFSSGQINMAPSTARLHGFSDAIALVGLFPQSKSIQGYDADRIVIKNDKASVEISSSKIRIKNDTKNLKTELQALTSQLNSLCTQINAITVLCAAPATPSGTPINAAAIAAISSNISTISSNIGNLLE